MRKKNILAVLLSLIVIISLVACRNNVQESSTEDSFNTKTESKDIINSTKVEDNEDITSKDNTDINVSTKETGKNDDIQTTDNNDSKNIDVETVIDDEYVNMVASEGFKFESNKDGTCTLMEIGVCEDKIIVIPNESPKGDKVTKIAEYAFYDCEDIETIIFVGTTMELDSHAFQTCKFEKLIITGCNLVVGENAFSYGEELNNLIISRSNVKLGKYAFYNCPKLVSISICVDSTIDNTTIFIGNAAFQMCEKLNTVVMDSENIEIEKNAFSYCEELIEVTIESENLKVGKNAFFECHEELVIIYNSGKYDADSIEDME